MVVLFPVLSGGRSRGWGDPGLVKRPQPDRNQTTIRPNVMISSTEYCNVIVVVTDVIVLHVDILSLGGTFFSGSLGGRGGGSHRRPRTDTDKAAITAKLSPQPKLVLKILQYCRYIQSKGSS